MTMDSLYIAIDKPLYKHADLPYLRTMLDVIKSSVAERWARISSDPLPAYRLWVEGTDTGVAFGYRRRDTTPHDQCPVLEFVRASIHFDLNPRPHEPVEVHVGAPIAHMPCSSYRGAKFLDDIWVQTGADVPGESTCYTCRCGARHVILIKE